MSLDRGHGTRRVWVPAAFFGAFSLIILGRLVQLQVIEHPKYAKAAQNELVGTNTTYAPRGSILDRNGNVLALSVDTWDIYINTRVWQDPAKAAVGSKALAAALNLDAATLQQQESAAAANGTVDYLVKRSVDYDLGNSLMTTVPGLIQVPNSQRVHPDGDIASSILGITGLDNTGLAGIEDSYNQVLQGTPGKTIYERDATDQPIPFGRYSAIAPQPGKDLVLTIDSYIQQMAETRLAAAIQQHRAQGGDIIVMNPSTGALLAMATSPGLAYSTLNLNDPKSVALLRNRAVTDLYEPGSVMKIVTTSGALNEGLVTPDTTYVDTGVVYISGVPLRNWDLNVYGKQTMTGVLENSINTGAVFMVEKMGATIFQHYLDAFGFGKPTGIDLMGEASGIFRRPSDPGWSPVDLATQSFGQSISVTPVQMINAVAAAINGGHLMKPHMVKAEVTADGLTHPIAPQVLGTPITAQTSATIRSMLHAVVEQDPPNESLRNPTNYTAGGKSGTANIPVYGTYNNTQVASFIGFAPWNDPKILILITLDNNADGATGTMAAGPIFSKMADDILAYMGVPPDKGPNKP